MKILFHICNIYSDQTFTLEADGDPTTLTMDVEVAVPESGKSMEITFYDVEKDMKTSCCGRKTEKDGSTRITTK
ncbi:MAG: hypothetical protein LUC37_00995 [Prevotella sp.]|nr:hypothetical protein [Prevotella sp.]